MAFQALNYLLKKDGLTFHREYYFNSMLNKCIEKSKVLWNQTVSDYFKAKAYFYFSWNLCYQYSADGYGFVVSIC